MRRTMFEAGFSSPRHSFGIQPSTGSLSAQPIPVRMGSLWSDVKGIFEKAVAPTPAPVTNPLPLPPPADTILGIPTSSFMIGAAILLGMGVVVVIMRSKPGTPGPSSPKVSGRRRR